MSTPLQLTVHVDDASPEELANITRELNAWITDTVPQVRTSLPPPTEPRTGDKGIEIAIGTLVLALIKSGAASALANCLTTYIKERRRSVKLEIRDAAGRTVSLSADSIGRGELPGLLRQMNDLASGTEPAAAT